MLASVAQALKGTNALMPATPNVPARNHRRLGKPSPAREALLTFHIKPLPPQESIANTV